jgi:hypothetical protein
MEIRSRGRAPRLGKSTADAVPPPSRRMMGIRAPRFGMLCSTKSAVIQELLLALGLLRVLWAEVLATRQSRLFLRRQKLRHRLCRRHG